MGKRILVFVGVFGAALLAGCGPGPTESPSGEGGQAAESAINVSGLYEVKGTTTVLSTGDTREIAGKVILSQDGNRYSSTFSLSTVFPTPEGSRNTDVIGKGEGSVEGALLTGTAETQVIMASISGVDPEFPYLPRVIGARIASTTEGSVGDDGKITVEISSRQAGATTYMPTRTRLVGFRVDPRSLRPVGAPAGADD